MTATLLATPDPDPPAPHPRRDPSIWGAPLVSTSCRYAVRRSTDGAVAVVASRRTSKGVAG